MRVDSTKILQTSFYNPFENRGGGVEQVIYNLAKNLSKLGNDVDITCIGSKDNMVETKYGKLFEFGVPEFKIIGKFSIFFMKALYNRKIRKFIKDNGSNYDVIHVHGDIGGFKELGKFNTVLTLHGFSIQTHENRNIFDRLFIRFTSGKTEIKNMIFAKKIIAVSNAVKKYASKYTFKKIMVLYNGVDCQKYKPLKSKDRKKLRQRLGFKNDIIYLLFVGGDAYRKGLDIAINTLNFFKNQKVYLNVIGLKKFEDKTPNNIRFLGRISEQKKIKYYQASDIFLLPSRGEGFAIAPLEAMACGLPVVVSKYSGVNEIISNMKNGAVVKTNKPKSYYLAINTVLNRRFNKKLRTNARLTAIKYDYRRLSIQYLYLYNFTRN